MAMLDDRSFLVAHIRNSFITSDDTGMCEMILEGDDMSERLHTGSERRPTSWPHKFVALNSLLFHRTCYINEELIVRKSTPFEPLR